MKCPNCGLENPENAAECRSCGLLFSKWRAGAEASAPWKSAEDTAPWSAPRKPALPAKAPVADAQGSSGGEFWNWLIGLLLLAAGLAGIYWALKPPGRPGSPGAADGALLVSPKPYKEQIVALEAALYKDEPANYQDGAAVEQAAGGILEKFISYPRLLRHDSYEQISTLGAMAGAENMAYPDTARRDWITMWEEARDGVFERAAWFHPPAPVSPRAAAGVDQSAVAISLQRTLSWADRLIEEARAETEPFGGDSVDLKNYKKKKNGELLEKWRAWVTRWQGRVGEAAAALPDRNTIDGKDLRDADRALRQVLGLLADPPDPGAGVSLAADDPLFKARYLPGKPLREEWLKTAGRRLEEPRSVLMKPGPGQQPR